MSEMQTSFPDGFQEKFFSVSSSNIAETLRMDAHNQVYVPCGMKHTEVDVPDDETDPSKGTHKEDRYAWIAVRIPYCGEDLSDQTAFMLARYSELRAFFYGSAIDQLEMDKDGQKTKHIWAVQIMFPQTAGDLPADYVMYRTYKKSFWTLIKDTVTAKGGDFDKDVPKDFFNASWMLQKAQELGCTETEILTLTLQIQTLTLNMLANKASYNDFFPYDDDINWQA